jgi:hypothetical protein
VRLRSFLIIFLPLLTQRCFPPFVPDPLSSVPLHYVKEKWRIGQEGGYLNALVNQTLGDIIDAATVREAYTWAFSEAVRSGCGAIMCSYNKLNGTLTCEDDAALNGLLKEEVRFSLFSLSVRRGADMSFISSTLPLRSSPTGALQRTLSPLP